MEQYQLWKSMIREGLDVSFWQEFYVKFYQAFIEGDRWKQYLNGVGTTLMVTALALLIGIALGVLVAMIRTAHDQQRSGLVSNKKRLGYWIRKVRAFWQQKRHGMVSEDEELRFRNPILGLLNSICQVYVTVIRGTPMMVQLLIMGFVIFSSSRNYTMVGALTLGINSGAYVAEIIRGGLMSLDPGQAEAGRSLGLGYIDTMRYIVIPQAFKAILPSLGNEFIILLKDTSLITVIGGKELVYAAQAIYGRTYEQMFPLIGIACVYLLLVIIFSWLLSILERRLRQSDRR